MSKVIRIIVYKGKAEDLIDHLGKRCLVGSTIRQFGGKTKVQMREYFLSTDLTPILESCNDDLFPVIYDSDDED